MVSAVVRKSTRCIVHYWTARVERSYRSVWRPGHVINRKWRWIRQRWCHLIRRRIVTGHWIRVRRSRILHEWRPRTLSWVRRSVNHLIWTWVRLHRRLGMLYMRGRWIWVLPYEIIPVAHWVSIHIAVCWKHAIDRVLLRLRGRWIRVILRIKRIRCERNIGWMSWGRIGCRIL